MEKLRNTLNKVLNLLAGLSMTVMVVLTTYQVIVRYIFNSPSTWSEELVGYLFGWSTMLGATIVSGERGHMNIPVLVDRFNPIMRKAFHIFAEVIAFLFSATILVFGGFQVSQLAMGQQTSSLGVAVGVFYWVMPICGVIILVYSVLNIIGIANGSICLDTPEDADGCRCRQGKQGGLSCGNSSITRNSGSASGAAVPRRAHLVRHCSLFPDCHPFFH